MINGYFGEEDELIFDIDLITIDGLELSVEAIMDTGFSGWLAIDRQDIDGLGWTYLGQSQMRMAKGGDVEFNLYTGTVQMGGQKFDILVHVGEEVPEILLGRQWLKNRRLVVNFPLQLLTLD